MNKGIFLVGFLPTLGLLVSLILNFLAGPGYTSAVNQGAITFYFMGAVIWSVVAFFIGIFLYTKCRSMNHIKFILGVLSVSLGMAMPWLIGMS